ncbi:MAG: protein translocase subunit SecF [Rhodospirillales bacterium]|nr:protein translocase subunit SecF [Rhodospirillales bacterium]MSP81041.1 protein translocase subunit SecF [Rhodospirillales bacterium]
MFRGIVWIPPDTHIPFIRLRMVFFAISGFLMVATAVLLVARGLNYGIDFTGGVMIEARFPGPVDMAATRAKVDALNLGGSEIQSFGGPNEVLIRLGRQEGDEKAQGRAVEKVKSVLGEGVEYRRVEAVGPKVGAELLRESIVAVIVSLGGIMVYLWLRFEWKWGAAGIIALFHDVISTIGVFSLSGLEFNLSTVAALLTIAGYSINDTVVIFDRVRENLRKFKTMPLPELFDRSINETLSRTINTSGTVFLTVVALSAFGGPVIRDFSFALLWGVVVGSYSTICVALPLLLYMNIDRGAHDRPAPEAAPGTS